MDLVKKIDEFLNEAEWGDKVTHPGILGIKDSENVMDKDEKYFIALAKKKGRDPVVKAIMNLYRWNKNSNPKLSNWAKNMQEKVSAALDKE